MTSVAGTTANAPLPMAGSCARASLAPEGSPSRRQFGSSVRPLLALHRFWQMRMRRRRGRRSRASCADRHEALHARYRGRHCNEVAKARGRIGIDRQRHRRQRCQRRDGERDRALRVAQSLAAGRIDVSGLRQLAADSNFRSPSIGSSPKAPATKSRANLHHHQPGRRYGRR
jgi:hypothetical protein